MSKRYLTVYNLNYEKDWVLKNAFDIVETQEINTVWELEFSIPKNDQDMEHCQPYWYVRFGDDGQMYRITEQVKTNTNESSVTYHCEHVIATLTDDIMFQGPHFKGGIGHYTTEVLNFILDKQTERNGQRPWKLGRCEPRRQFEYSWENENLLAALFSVPNCFATPYMWTYDTSSYPWTINLLNIDEDADPDFYLMARKNILQSTESSSNLEICTRLYGLGEGEGVNQLTIKSVNNGLPYIQSSPEKIAEYGIVSRIFVDRRYQYPETLKARMETLLHELETPSMKREFDIVDLYDMSPDDMYKAEVGKICLLKDDNTKVYITKTVKNWTVPGDMKITIATKATDISTSIADLADRQRIEQVYSQGASQVYSFSFFGNATAEYPLDGYVYFPEDLKYLNEVKLKVKLDPFRSYSKATDTKTVTVQTCENKVVTVKSFENKTVTIKTNPTALDGIETTKAGGGTTSNSGAATIKVSGGSTSGNSTDEMKDGLSLSVSASGTVSAPMASQTSGPSTNITSDEIWGYENFPNLYTDTASAKQNNVYTENADGSDGDHNHQITSINIPSLTIEKEQLSHKHNINHYHTVTVGGSASGGIHTHSFTVPNHSHIIPEHSHNLPSLSHNHQIVLNGHTHTIELNGHTHTIKLNGHSHDITPGIFTSGNPTKADLLINGAKKATITTANSELDITEYLLTNGKVPRGQWIKISIKPTDASPNDMAYISVFGNVFAFIQSYTGGNF